MCMRYISYVESFRSNFLLVIESARDRSYSNEEPARTLAAKQGNSRRCLLLLSFFFLLLFSFSRTKSSVARFSAKSSETDIGAERHSAKDREQEDTIS